MDFLALIRKLPISNQKLKFSLFLCCGVLSLITSHLKSICSYSLSIIFTFLSTLSSMFFIYVGEVVRTFSNNVRDYRTNLALAIIGTLVHGALLLGCQQDWDFFSLSSMKKYNLVVNHWFDSLDSYEISVYRESPFLVDTLSSVYAREGASCGSHGGKCCTEISLRYSSNFHLATYNFLRIENPDQRCYLFARTSQQ